MKPSTQYKAGISSEPLHDTQKTITDSMSAIERVDTEFYKNLANIAEKVLPARHEEDILALRAIENAYHERSTTIALNILVKALSSNEAVSDTLLASSKQLLPEEEYLFLMDVLKKWAALSNGTKVVPKLFSES